MIEATLPADSFEGGEQPNCPACGTVMRDVDGGYECRFDGTRIDVPYIERSPAGDALPGVLG